VAGQAALLAPALRGDFAALCAWLREFERKPNTVRAYTREARRFWHWLTSVRATTLARFNRADVDLFRAHLASPTDPQVAPVSDAGIRQALVILQAFFGYLVDAGYLRRNVFRLVRDKGPSPKRKHRPVPSDATMRATLTWLREDAEHPPNGSEAQRLARRDALVWTWCYLAGARRHEVGPITLGALQVRYTPAGMQWFWEVVGKGDKLAYVPIEPKLVQLVAWSQRLSTAELPAAIDTNASYRICGVIRGPSARPMSAAQVYDSVKRSAARLAVNAASFGASDHEAGLLARMRPHDLRAARSTHLLATGCPDRLVQRFMRHGSINTTLIYDHTADVDLYRSVVHATAAP
jgi:site-specific recombinase XerD